MLSEGVHGVDNVYSLRDGILTMTLDKETYERAGLVGKPDGAKGARAARARWIVEINLRQPSMLHGKKGFDRIVYAAKNVLNKPAKWLFCNLQSVDEDGKKSKSWAGIIHVIVANSFSTFTRSARSVQSCVEAERA